MEFVEGQYEIQSLKLTALAEKYGSPLYLYDTANMERQYQRLMNAFPGVRLRLNYACKALTNINILKFFNQLGAGLDAVSIQEVQIGLKAGFAAEKISFTPSGIHPEEAYQAVGLKVPVTLDSLSLLEKFGKKYGSSVPVSIRINPHVMGGGHAKISTGHKGSKFGISFQQLPQILDLVNQYRLHVRGLHMHTGSDILDISIFLKSAEVLFDVAGSFPQLEFIDMGSGFKVPYKPGDYETDIEELGRLLSERFNQFCDQYGKNLTLIFEPGKFLVSTAGYFITRVNVIKETPLTVFAGVNSGQNHLIRPMFYDAYHHIVNISNPEGAVKPYSVVGYICETDTFAWERELPEVREGDYLVFLNAGAYGFSMASNYNSRLRPAEVMIHKGKDLLIRERETLDNLLRNQIVHQF